MVAGGVDEADTEEQLEQNKIFKINVNTPFKCVKLQKETENEEKLRLRALAIKRKALCASHYVFLKSFCSLRSFVFASFMKMKKKSNLE